jgi:hypothetical protein
MEKIEIYAKERADIAYGKQSSKQKDEYMQNIIKKNMKWWKHEGGKLGETTATHSHHGFQIQSVLVPKNKFSKSEAVKYIKEHFEYKKIDSTQRPNFYSFRQLDPTKNSKYFTKILDNGVELVFEKPPIGPNGIKPHFLPKSNIVEREKIGGSLKVNQIYQVIKNGYTWSDLKPIPQFTFIKDLSSKYHQVYENKEDKKIILNYTGSKGAIDLLNNIDYLLQTYPLTPRFLKAKEVFNKVLKMFPNYSITLVSHSQGGIITRELSRLYGDEIFEIIALNPGESSFVEDIKSYFGEGKRNKEHEYTIKSEVDFASFFAKKGKNDIIIPKVSNNPIKEHKAEILFRLNPDLEIGRK